VSSIGAERTGGRLRARGRRISPDRWAMLLVAAAVLLANLPYLVGFLHADPLGVRSALATSVLPGPLRGQPTIDPNNGFISQALSHRAALDWLHLRVPWWNPYEGTGTPLAGEMQSAALFPPTLLTLLQNGQLYEHVLLELIAGLSTYLLLRRICVNRWAATAAAIAFALNGTFAWFSHATVNPVAFLPLLLLGVERAYAAGVAGRRGGWGLIAVSGALSFYAGFPEVAYIDTVLAVGWFAWRGGCLERERLRAFVGKGAAGALVGTLLAAPLLLASIDYVNQANLGLHGSNYFGALHLVPQQAPQLLMPYVYGPIFGFSDPKLLLFGTWGSVGGYLSSSLLLFGLIGLMLSRGRRGLKGLLLVWIVLVLARTYDSTHLLGQVLGVLPGMSQVAFFRYGSSSLELAVIVLAALGMDHLAQPGLARRRMLLIAVVSLVVVAVAAVVARPLAHQLGSAFAQRPYFKGSVVWAAAIVIAGGAVAALVRSARARALLLAVLVVGDALVLFAIPEFSAPRRVQSDLAPVAFLQRHLGTSRFFTLGPLQPNYGAYFGIASLNVNDIPTPRLFARYVHDRLDAVVDPTVFVGNSGGGRPAFASSPQQELLKNLDGYRDAGVGYVLAPAGTTLPQSAGGLNLVFRSPSTSIYRLVGAASYFTAPGAACRVSFQARESAELSCSRPGTLIRRETDLPGWSARIDGRPARMHRASGIFQAVDVGAGSHRLTFSYLPRYVGWALLAFAGGCLWLLVAALARRRKPTVTG